MMACGSSHLTTHQSMDFTQGTSSRSKYFINSTNNSLSHSIEYQSMSQPESVPNENLHVRAEAWILASSPTDMILLERGHPCFEKATSR
jgi:hypothetical protein